MALPLDVWQLILNFNDSPSDIGSSELVCRAFKHLSRRRTSIDCHAIQWVTASKYPNLRRVTGLITDFCEDTFKSKIDNLLISSCNDEDMMDEMNRELLGYIIKYNKKAVRVYNGVIEDRYSTRELLYLWTDKCLVVSGCIEDFAYRLTDTYRSVYKDGQIIMYAAGTDLDIEIIETCVIDMFIINPGSSTPYEQLKSTYEMWIALEQIGTKQFVVQLLPEWNGVETWSRAWNEFWRTPAKCQFVISNTEFWTDKGWKLTEAEIKRAGFDNEDEGDYDEYYQGLIEKLGLI